MAKSIKLMVTDPYYASPDEVVEPGTLLELDADVPAGMRVKEVIHDDDPPAPQFHAAAPAAEPEDTPKAPAAAEEDEGDQTGPPRHRSAGGKAGGRA